MFIENTCQRYELQWVLKKIAPGQEVLDLGYGDGLFLDAVSLKSRLTLVEGSSELVEEAISKAKKLNRDVTIIHSLFENYVPEKKFDVIVASHVLEHVDEPALLLRKIKSWLKPEGQLICIVPNRESLHRRLGLKLNLMQKLDDLSPRDRLVGHQRVYSYATLLMDLNNGGLRTLEARGFFVKSLANSQMLNLSEEVIWGLCEISDDLPVEFGANIGLVAIHNEQ
jgi:SAM-dependent methyltransferase